MSLCDQRKTNDPNPSGKFAHVANPGVQQFSPQRYQGFSYSVGRRTVGVTVKRVQYSVSIFGGDGRQARYLENFATIQDAQQAARDWIDLTRYHLKLERARAHAREMREAKLRQALAARQSA